MLGQLLRPPEPASAKAGGRAKVGVLLARDRQRRSANLIVRPMISGFAAVLGQQARGPVLPEAAQQTNHLMRL